MVLIGIYYTTLRVMSKLKSEPSLALLSVINTDST
eukprot:COSAG01_NODE_5124_length_4470_cov_10.204987_1_plen_35_part_00